MPKRKAEAMGDVLVDRVKKIKSPNSSSTYSSQQKTAMAEFGDVTGVKEQKSAAKWLKQHGYNVTAAVNAYFSNPSNTAANPIRTNMSKVFDKYRDNPRDEPDEIDVEGTSKLLSEMGIGLEDIGSLVFSELVSSPSLGKITREGFLDGASEVNADSITKLRNVVMARRTQLRTDRELFKNVYNHTFTLALQGNQKSLPPEIALEFWRLLFSADGFEWRAKNRPWLDWWLEFQEEKWKKAVNKDLWKQTLNFAERSMKDGDLGFWSEDSSWPSVIDSFVEFVKQEKGVGGGGGDAMEVE